MAIKYKILAKDPKQHSIIVRYFSDEVPETALLSNPGSGDLSRCRTDFSVDLPIPIPTGQDLVDYIMARAPVDWLVLQASVVNPQVDTSMDVLDTALGEVVSTPSARNYYTDPRGAAKRAREKAVATLTVTVGGRVYNADEASQNRVTRVVASMGANPTAKVQWILADNSVATVPVSDLESVLAAAVAAQQALWII